MATQNVSNDGQPFTETAGAGLGNDAAIGKACRVSDAGLVQTAGANQIIVAVCVGRSTSNDAGGVASFRDRGLVTVIAGGAITVGQGLLSAAAGRVTGAAIDSNAKLRAVTAASAAGGRLQARFI